MRSHGPSAASLWGVSLGLLFLAGAAAPGDSALQEPFPVVLNEVLPAPRDVDWDGDGSADAKKDEWVELHNSGPGPVDLEGWVLDDIPDGGTPPHFIPSGTVVPAGGFLVLFGSATGVGLNNDGDTVRLLRPDNTVADSFTYSALSGFYDRSFSREPDATGNWTDTNAPTPGEPNAPVPVPTPVDSPTVSPTPTPTLTATPTSTLTPTPSETATASPPALALIITEALYDGTASTTEGDEFVEILNPNPGPVNLGGYLVGDEETPGGGEGAYTFPTGATVGPGEVLIVAKNAAGFSARFGFLPDFEARVDGGGFLDSEKVPNLVRRTDLGSGHWALSNSGDEVLLWDPSGSLVDSIAYGNGDRVAAGVVGDVRASAPLSLQRSGVGDSDDMEADFRAADPTPGMLPEPLPTATPSLPTLEVVWLSEFLPQPGQDWNGDGRADSGDEWVEVYNPGPAPGDLGGWQLDDIAGGGSPPYIVPMGTVISPGGYWVLYGAETGVRLNDAGDSVRLLRPDGTLADQATYDASPGRDRGLSRAAPGPGPWSDGFWETPGGPNQPRPPEDLSEMEDTGSVSAARTAAPGTLIVTSGQVTVPPGVLGPRILYLQGPDAGIRVRLKEDPTPYLRLGDWVRVRGVVSDRLGEPEIVVEGTDGVSRLREAAPRVPERTATGAVSSGLVGRLVQVAGYVASLDRQAPALWLDDGTGSVRVDLSGRVVEWVVPGEFLEAVAVVGSEEGTRLRLRFLEELRPPGGIRWLPVAGLQVLGSWASAAGV